MIAARGETKNWLEFTEQLAMWDVTARRREAYLKSFLPASDDMTTRQRDNVMENRTKIRLILESDTCSEIANTGYGLLMASTEWADHYRPFRSTDSYVSRQLLSKEPFKARSARVLRGMAGVSL